MCGLVSGVVTSGKDKRTVMRGHASIVDFKRKMRMLHICRCIPR